MTNINTLFDALAQSDPTTVFEVDIMAYGGNITTTYHRYLSDEPGQLDRIEVIIGDPTNYSNQVLNINYDSNYMFTNILEITKSSQDIIIKYTFYFPKGYYIRDIISHLDTLANLIRINHLPNINVTLR